MIRHMMPPTDAPTTRPVFESEFEGLKEKIADKKF